MKEIKFRAYIPKLNKMLPVNAIEWHYETASSATGKYQVLSWIEATAIDDDDQQFDIAFDATKGTAPIVRYTGLKDKNGKEIWEGDIVEVSEDCKTHGKVQDDGSTLWNVIDKGLRFEVYHHTMQPSIELMPIGEAEEVDIDTVMLWLWNNDGGSEGLKVIGNIYENKDLLK